MSDLSTHGLTVADVEAMNDAELVRLIRRDWTNVWFGAEPHLGAMEATTAANPETGLRDAYGYDSPGAGAAYFLANAAQWKGETARVVKAALKAPGRY